MAQAPPAPSLLLRVYAVQAYISDMTLVIKQDRLAVRVTTRQKQTIERAAEVLGRNVTEFSVETLTSRAEEVLAGQSVFDVSPQEWSAFVSALDEPPRPVVEIVELLRRPAVFD